MLPLDGLFAKDWSNKKWTMEKKFRLVDIVGPLGCLAPTVKELRVPNLRCMDVSHGSTLPQVIGFRHT